MGQMNVQDITHVYWLLAFAVFITMLVWWNKDL